MDEVKKIFDNILVVCEVTCSFCKKRVPKYNTEKQQAANEFSQLGWRATKMNNIYCPDCSKLKLKS